MCMSYNHPKTIRMHALTLFNDMRRPKLPQRPRGSPGAFTFSKNFEHTRTNQYTPLPTVAPILRCPSWSWARRQRQKRRFEPLHRTGLRPAPPPVGNSLSRQFVSPDLSGNFVSPGIFFSTICVARVAALPRILMARRPPPPLPPSLPRTQVSGAILPPAPMYPRSKVLVLQSGLHYNNVDEKKQKMESKCLKKIMWPKNG